MSTNSIPLITLPKAEYCLSKWGAESKQIKNWLFALSGSAALAAEMGIPVSQLKESFDQYNDYAKKGSDPFGKIYFTNAPFHIDDSQIVEKFFKTLQSDFLEVFHPILITTRAYKKFK